MTALNRSLSSANRRETPSSTRRLGCALLLSFACIFLGWGAGAPTVRAAADRVQTGIGTTAPGPVAFPAAAGIRPGTGPVGPVQIEPEPDVLSQFVRPDDVAIFDSTNSSIIVIGGGFNDTFGAATVVASTSVGTGLAFHNNITQGCISPSQQLYYWDGNLLAFVAIDLTQSTYPRTLVPVPANTALVPGSFDLAGIPLMVWDYSTNTILYLDNGAASAKSTITRGLYRLNPVTGTNTLVASGFASGLINALAVKQDGSAIYFLHTDLNNSNNPAAYVAQIAADGTFTIVDGGMAAYGTTATNARYYLASGLSWDIFNQKLNVYDQGNDQTTSRIIRVDPVARTRAFISNSSAGPSATRDTNNLVNDPIDGVTTTAGRLVYSESDVNLTVKFPAYINSGSPASTRVNATNYGYNAYVYAYVPPTLPTIATPTATVGTNGATATLGATVNSAGTALVTPTIQTRGIVYSSTNTNPTVGGAGVTPVAASAALGTYTVSASGLASGTTYYYAGYVSTYYGTVYTAVSTFVTPSAPAVTTTSPATAITSNSATLSGNVTGDGGSTVTARGIVYAMTATNGTPLIGGTGVTNLIDASATTGAFSEGATGLASNTGYSYRAYATNAVGTTYGPVVTFTTAAGTPTATSQSGIIVLLNTAKAITLAGTDPDNPPLALIYTVQTAPANGTLSGTAPNLTYTPAAGYTGPDSFTFTVSNGQKTSTAATVSLTVVGQPYVTSFTASGQVGSTVTITGNNLLGMTGVTFFRNVNAPTFTVVSDTQMTVVVPTGAKTGVITLTNGLGTNTTSTKFTVLP